MGFTNQQRERHMLAILSILAARDQVLGEDLVRDAVRIDPSLALRGPYAVLVNLERRQLVVVEPKDQAGRPRLKYSLTAAGRRKVEEATRAAIKLKGRA